LKIIIAGGRNITYSPEKIDKVVKTAEKSFGQKMTELVCGMAPKGIDLSAVKWYKKYGKPRGIKLKPMPADWEGARKKFGSHKQAGHIRNAAMADYAEGLILIWDQKSPGSTSMYTEALLRGFPILEVLVSKEA